MKKYFVLGVFVIFCSLSFAQVKITFKTGKVAKLKSTDDRLFLAGSFNNWNPADTAWELKKDASGVFSFAKNSRKDIYNFKVTRGSWETVECSAIGTPIENRNIDVKTDTTLTLNIENWQDNFPAPEKKHAAGAQVHIISEKFEMPQLGRQRRIWIYLPAAYETLKEKYPVIYMQDGQNLFDAYTAAYGEWGIDEIMDKMPAKESCIIVGIDHGGDYRLTEYNPYDTKYGKGRGDDYVDFLAKTLKPYIDQHYRTKTGAPYTTIAGSSMGGLITMYAILKYPEIFGNAGVFSPSFWIAPDVYTFAQQKQLPVQNRFYFVCGDAESKEEVTQMQKMAKIIHAKGFNNQQAPVIIVKGAAHNEKQWNGDFPGFYKWLMGF
jgi:predicted alpha/beta superfamily hydrolase